MTIQNLFFIDARVENHQALVAGLQTTDAWVLLNEEQDGLDQMVRALGGVKDLGSIQIISHGSEGALYLGSTVLDSGYLASYAAQLASIGSALTQSGDILLYGCNVAQGDVGVQFINSLAEATGADVAASSNATGASQLGGDWVLERAEGSVTAAMLPHGGLGGLLAANTASTFTLRDGIFNVSFGVSRESGIDVDIQSDGKTLVTIRRSGSISITLIARFNSDGSADKNFGSDGDLVVGDSGGTQDLDITSPACLPTWQPNSAHRLNNGL